MLTKAQKKEHVELGVKLAKGSQAMVFADFTGVPTSEIRRLKIELKKAGAKFKVIKKRLLKLALKDVGVEVDPTQFSAQVGTIFAPSEMTSVAGPVYKFSKELAKAKKDFKILGAYDAVEKKFLNLEEFTIIAKLPSREILLAQVVGVMAGPIRAFMYVIDQMSKKASAPSAGVENKTVEQEQVKS